MPKVGILSTSASRQSGGLLWPVLAHARGLMNRGQSVKVLSGRDEDSDRDLHYWRSIDVTLLGRRPPRSFGYMPELAAALRSADLALLHTHGIWMYPSRASLRWHREVGRPLVISPHGMLDTWALRQARLKKRLASWAYEDAHLRSASCLHALCLSEYRAIRRYGLRNPVAVIPNGVDLTVDTGARIDPAWATPLPANSKVLLFLGRIHPKKGLMNLLQAWNQVHLSRDALVKPWHLAIAGWDQAGHQAELERYVASLDSRDSIHFIGPQFDEAKHRSLARANAFILPSYSEGLPMAVLEAWAYSVPVLMTRECNLPEGFDVGAAVKIAPDRQSIVDGLLSLFGLSEAELREMGLLGRKLVEGRFHWDTVCAQLLAMYHWLWGQGSRPDFVIND